MPVCLRASALYNKSWTRKQTVKCVYSAVNTRRKRRTKCGTVSRSCWRSFGMSSLRWKPVALATQRWHSPRRSVSRRSKPPSRITPRCCWNTHLAKSVVIFGPWRRMFLPVTSCRRAPRSRRRPGVATISWPRATSSWSLKLPRRSASVSWKPTPNTRRQPGPWVRCCLVQSLHS